MVQPVRLTHLPQDRQDGRLDPQSLSLRSFHISKLLHHGKHFITRPRRLEMFRISSSLSGSVGICV